MTERWCQTKAGVPYTPLDPKPEHVVLEDIAHSLAHQCRFTGHTIEFYSVAEHSVLASYLVPDEHRMAALMHDSAEAYVGDWPRPLKVVGYPGDETSLMVCGDSIVSMANQAARFFRGIEEKNLIVIFRKFGIPYPLPQEVKDADLLMLGVEKRDLMCRAPKPWDLDVNVDGFERDWIKCWSPQEAKRQFLDRFDELWGRAYSREMRGRQKP